MTQSSTSTYTSYDLTTARTYQSFAAELRKNPALSDDANMREWSMRQYRRFHSESELANYASRIRGGDSLWFSAGAKRFFNSRIGACLHGQSPANWNLFITSERYDHRSPRRYTIRQLLITGQIETIGEFQAYGSSAAAQRAARRYIAAQEQGQEE